MGGQTVLRAPVEERSPSYLSFYDFESGSGSHIEFRDVWGRVLGRDGEPGEIPPDATTLFGPGGPSAGVKWRIGRDALRRLKDGVPFLDGSRRITFETGGGQLGLTGDACYWMGYTAEKDCEVYVVLRLQKLGRIARTIHLPAGESMRIEIPTDDELLGSGKSGRRILSFGIEPKGTKPGQLRVLRLFKVGELAE